MFVITIQNRDGNEVSIKVDGTLEEVEKKAKSMCQEGDQYFIEIYL